MFWESNGRERAQRPGPKADSPSGKAGPGSAGQVHHAPLTMHRLIGRFCSGAWQAIAFDVLWVQTMYHPSLTLVREVLNTQPMPLPLGAGESSL